MKYGVDQPRRSGTWKIITEAGNARIQDINVAEHSIAEFSAHERNTFEYDV